MYRVLLYESLLLTCLLASAAANPASTRVVEGRRPGNAGSSILAPEARVTYANDDGIGRHLLSSYDRRVATGFNAPTEATLASLSDEVAAARRPRVTYATAGNRKLMGSYARVDRRPSGRITAPDEALVTLGGEESSLRGPDTMSGRWGDRKLLGARARVFRVCSNGQNCAGRKLLSEADGRMWRQYSGFGAPVDAEIVRARDEEGLRIREAAP